MGTKILMSIVFVFVAFSAFKAMLLLEPEGCIVTETDDSQVICTEVPDFSIDPFPDYTFVWNPVVASNLSGTECAWFRLSCWFSPAATLERVIVNIGAIFYEIGEMTWETIKWAGNVLVWFLSFIPIIFKFTSFLLTITFTEIPGAPWWVEMMFLLPLIFGAIFIIAGLIRGTSS